MWIESYIVSRYTCCLKQNNYISDHVKNIAKTCVWGTSLEIIAVASIFQMDIYVVTDLENQHGWNILPTWR